jgi:hypothetical protein
MARQDIDVSYDGTEHDANTGDLMRARVGWICIAMAFNNGWVINGIDQGYNTLPSSEKMPQSLIKPSNYL